MPVVQETLATPQIALGIPVPGGNFQTPATSGIPPHWSAGTAITGHVYALHELHGTLSQFSAEYQRANPYGCGRSILVDGQSDTDGGSQSFIRSAATPYGLVPHPGAEVTVNLGALIVASGSLSVSRELTVQVEQYDANGTEIGTEDTLGTVTSSAISSSGWLSTLVSADIAKHAACQYFKVLLKFDLATSDWFALDFVGLGWIPLNTGQDAAMQTLGDDYVGSNLSMRWVSGAEVIRAHAGFGLWTQQLGRNMRRAEMALEFIRAAQSTRDDLAFFWYAQQGALGNGTDAPGYGNQLGAEPWPILFRPRRPGAKQGLYARFTKEPFFLDVDTRAGYAEDPVFWSGVAELEELIY